MERLTPKDGNGLSEEFLNNKWYKEVERLASLPDNDSTDGPVREKATLPSGRWGLVYGYIFERHQDRNVSYAMTGFSLFGLIVGTAHSIALFDSISCWFSGETIDSSFYVLAASMLVPILFVLCGGKVTQWARYLAEENVNELEKLMQGSAKQAQLKTEEELGALAT